jgi:signal transduction histidine kinase
MTNLVANALEAMPEGGRLTLALGSDGESVQVTVEDTGQGIPKDRMDQIFEAFFTSKPTGAGLGLALCKKLVAQHGATMNVESEEGEGTKFIISFPIPTEQPAQNGTGPL